MPYYAGVYVDDKKQGEVSGNKTTFEYYTTKVSIHKVYIKAILDHIYQKSLSCTVQMCRKNYDNTVFITFVVFRYCLKAV